MPNNSDDGSVTPPQRLAVTRETTYRRKAKKPSPRVKLEKSTPLKIRAAEVDPGKGRCMIQNVAPARGVVYSHCVPRSLREDVELMTKLEWYWGLEYFMLNLDTRDNAFPADASLHAMHDGTKGLSMWLLLPAQEIIDRFHATLMIDEQGDLIATRYNFPEIQESECKYRLIPMPGEMLHFPILRQEIVPPQGNNVITPNHFTIHTHPFNKLPTFTSHLHPQFAILEAGRQLSLLPEADRIQFIQEEPLLDRLAQIYSAWTRDLPAGAMDDQDFVGEREHDYVAYYYDYEEEDEDEDLSVASDHTLPGRFHTGRCSCILEEIYHAHDDRCRCQRRRDLCPRHHGVLYECAFLRYGREGENRGRRQRTLWTSDLIRVWSKECSAFPHEGGMEEIVDSYDDSD